MEVTKLSTKGQIVIPEEFRKNLEVGTPFIISKQNDLIILKKVDGLTEKEKEEMKELNKIWRDIDNGKCESYSEEEFFEEMKKW